MVKKVKIRVVPDVNADSFLKSVPDGCCGIVAGFDQIFKSHAINSFSSLVNFHPSILPFYRGPVPSFWVIKNHELRTGFTLHCISEQIDAGEILFQEVVECETAESPDHLNRKIALAAQHTFDRYLDHLLSGKPWSVVKLDASTIYRVPLSYGRRPGSSSNRILPSLRKA